MASAWEVLNSEIVIISLASAQGSMTHDMAGATASLAARAASLGDEGNPVVVVETETS